MKEGGEGEGEPRFAGGRRARDARRRVPFHLMYRNHSGAVSVASRTSVRRWSTASVIACMGEESLLVWTCGFGDAERVSVVVDGRETRGRKP